MVLGGETLPLCIQTAASGQAVTTCAVQHDLCEVILQQNHVHVPKLLQAYILGELFTLLHDSWSADAS